MAWRPQEQFIEGVLDNTVPGRVSGWMRFAGMKERVILELEGDFHRDIRGARVKLHGGGISADPVEAARYMQGFSPVQKGKAGDMTAGREPIDYVDYGYFEWYSGDNGRVVIELDTDRVELLTRPIPACESDPIDRKRQAENMAGFLCELARGLNIPVTQALTTGDSRAVQQAKKVIANDRLRGMKLLPQALRALIPPLDSQDGKGGKAIAYVKFFTPDAGFGWWITEGSSLKDEQGAERDFRMFGLVRGQDTELGYVSLSELELLRGPLGLPVERDCHFQPTPLAEIAPELFRDSSEDISS